jgi:excisionase family DNA binding protein
MGDSVNELDAARILDALGALSRQVTQVDTRIAEMSARLVGQAQAPVVSTRAQSNDGTVYTTAVLAKALGYSEDQIRSMCELGRFPGAYRAGEGTHWRIPQEAVTAFKEACRPKIRRRA